MKRSEAVGERDDAVDVGEQASGNLGGHALAEGVVVGVGHAGRSLMGARGGWGYFSTNRGSTDTWAAAAFLW